MDQWAALPSGELERPQLGKERSDSGIWDPLVFTSAKETKDVNQFLYFEPAEGGFLGNQLRPHRR